MWFHLYKVPRAVKFIETESGRVNTRDLRRREMGTGTAGGDGEPPEVIKV